MDVCIAVGLPFPLRRINSTRLHTQNPNSHPPLLLLLNPTFARRINISLWARIAITTTPSISTPPADTIFDKLSYKVEALPKIEGQNYIRWAGAIKLALEAYDLWDIVYGTQNRPLPEAEAEKANQKPMLSIEPLDEELVVAFSLSGAEAYLNSCVKIYDCIAHLDETLGCNSHPNESTLSHREICCRLNCIAHSDDCLHSFWVINIFSVFIVLVTAVQSWMIQIKTSLGRTLYRPPVTYNPRFTIEEKGRPYVGGRRPHGFAKDHRTGIGYWIYL